MVTEKMADHFSAKSMNVAALGNVVPQLHVHHICRREDDPAWPGPVWGHSEGESYSPDDLEARVKDLQSLFERHFVEDLEAEEDLETIVYW